jgi:hypothetical protein
MHRLTTIPAVRLLRFWRQDYTSEDALEPHFLLPEFHLQSVFSLKRGSCADLGRPLDVDILAVVSREVEADRKAVLPTATETPFKSLLPLAGAAAESAREAGVNVALGGAWVGHVGPHHPQGEAADREFHQRNLIPGSN